MAGMNKMKISIRSITVLLLFISFVLSPEIMILLGFFYLSESVSSVHCYSYFTTSCLFPNYTRIKQLLFRFQLKLLIFKQTRNTQKKYYQ
jgi:hypothetical protein